MFRRVLIAALSAFALGGPAQAQAGSIAALGAFGPDVLCQILEPCQPPARYASGAFLVPPVVQSIPFRQVQAICGGSSYAAHAHDGDANFGIMGCAQLTDTRCVVHVPAEFKTALPDLYRLVLAHELGHCRGWVHAHY